MLQREGLTAVVIATPAETHLELAVAPRGWQRCVCEKPLALRVQEGKELGAAEAHGRILMVGHLMEYHPAVARIRELVRRVNWVKFSTSTPTD